MQHRHKLKQQNHTSIYAPIKPIFIAVSAYVQTVKMSNVDYSLVTTSSKTGDDNSATSAATSCAWWHGATLSQKVSYVFLGAVFVLIPTFVGLDAANVFDGTPAASRETTTSTMTSGAVTTTHTTTTRAGVCAEVNVPLQNVAVSNDNECWTACKNDNPLNRYSQYGGWCYCSTTCNSLNYCGDPDTVTILAENGAPSVPVCP